MHCCLRQPKALVPTIHSNLWESIDLTAQIRKAVGSSGLTPDFQSLLIGAFYHGTVAKIVSVVLTFLAERTDFSHFNR